jgi:hypothetical protein
MTYEGMVLNLHRGSTELLATLWREHPAIMGLAVMSGRALAPIPDAIPEPTPPRVMRAPIFGRELVTSVARDFDISHGELIGDCRANEFVDARSVVSRVLHDRGWSYPQIGRLLGGRDHSTVINLVRKFDVYGRRNLVVMQSYERHRPLAEGEGLQ